MTPKPQNIEFYPTAAAAEQHGFRAGKRCRPDVSPGSPEWNTREDVVARAMRLIADGVVDRDGVGGLAPRLSYSERHLTRLVTTSSAPARSRSPAPSVPTPRAPARDHGPAPRRHRVRRRVRQRPPVQRHRARSVRRDADGAARPPTPRAPPRRAPSLGLPVREPFDADDVLVFLAARAVRASSNGTVRLLPPNARLPGGHGTVAVRRGARPDAPMRPAVGRRLARRGRRGARAAGCSTSTPTRTRSTPRSAPTGARAVAEAPVGGPRQRRPPSSRSGRRSASRSPWPAPAPSPAGSRGRPASRSRSTADR